MGKFIEKLDSYELMTSLLPGAFFYISLKIFCGIEFPIENVVEEKLYFIQKYFKVVDEKGKNFLYNLLELVRKRKGDKINIARFAYLLGRMEPKVQRGEKKEEIEEKRDLHREFSRKMYEWIRVEKDAKELEMAIYLYVYTKREKEEHDGVNE